jgi:hypothetical protein
VLALVCSSGRTSAEDPAKKQIMTATAQVTRDFSKKHYCPEARVSASWLIPASPPPPDISNDPQRLVMWRNREVERATVSGRRLVAAEGCGERAVYACWAVGGPNPSGWERGHRFLLIGMACLEQVAVTSPP